MTLTIEFMQNIIQNHPTSIIKFPNYIKLSRCAFFGEKCIPFTNRALWCPRPAFNQKMASWLCKMVPLMLADLTLPSKIYF